MSSSLPQKNGERQDIDFFDTFNDFNVTTADLRGRFECFDALGWVAGMASSL